VEFLYGFEEVSGFLGKGTLSYLFAVTCGILEAQFMRLKEKLLHETCKLISGFWRKYRGWWLPVW